MNPVKGYTMLNFLNWLTASHPEVHSLRSLSERDLVRLVDEYEGGKVSINPTLKAKWLHGFDYLLKNSGDWEGYELARRTLESIED